MWPFAESDYLLVLEFPCDSSEHFDALTSLQDDLDTQLLSGKLDGNDVGSGHMNIFIVTKSPNQCFSEALVHVEKHRLRPIAAGIRDLKEEKYVRLWPKGDKSPFLLH
jgi:hypothetical protein